MDFWVTTAQPLRNRHATIKRKSHAFADHPQALRLAAGRGSASVVRELVAVPQGVGRQDSVGSRGHG